MEEHEKRIIKSNLDDLIEVTCCNCLLIASLTANGVLNKSDRATLKSIRNEMDQSLELYEIVMTKSNSFGFLLEALEKTNQTGAVAILKRSLDQTKLEPLTKTDAIKIKRGIRFDFILPIHNFSGRKMELQDLHNKLADSKIRTQKINLVSVVGLGGVGKTELCRKYAEQYSDYFDGNIIWFNAESKNNIDKSFDLLASHHLQLSLNWEDGKKKEIQTIVDEVYHVFTLQKCLFVFDNADCDSYLQKYLPLRVSTSASVLITSRDKNFDQATNVLLLNQLKESEGIEFIRIGLDIEINDNHQMEMVYTLAKVLQCLPLALQQAVSFIRQRRRIMNFNIVEYLKLFDKESKRILSSKIPASVLGCSTETTFTTWKITMDAIESDKDDGNLAIQILQILSYFAPENIAIDILSGLGDHDMDSVSFSLDLLARYSMLSRRKLDGSLCIHRLVQEVTKANLKDQNNEVHTLRVALNLTQKNPSEHSLMHAAIAYFEAVRYKELIVEFSTLPWTLILMYGRNFMYGQAKYLKDISLERLRQCLPNNHIDVIRTELHWAITEYIHSNFNIALEYFHKLEKYLMYEAEENFEKEVACLKFYIACTQLKLGREPTDSLNFAKQSLEATCSIYGLGNPETIPSMQLVALNLETVGSYYEALSVYRRCMKLYRGTISESSANSTEILLTMQNQAGLYIKMGKIDKAIQTSRIILKKSRKDLYKIDIRFSATGNNLAYCFLKKHQYVVATSIATAVYNFRKTVLGSEHLKTLIALQLLANLKASICRRDEALLIHEYVYIKFSEKLGKFHGETLTSKCNIATICSMLDMHDEAIESFQEILFQVKGNHVPFYYYHLNQVQYQYGMAYKRMGKFKEALDIFVDLETQLKTKFGDKHYDLSDIREKIFFLRSEIQKYSLQDIH